MRYEWEKDLVPYASQEAVKRVVALVEAKIKKGKRSKWISVLAGIVFIGLLISLIGIFDVFKLKAMDTKVLLINGLIALLLAFVTFFAPIQTQAISSPEVDAIIRTHVTEDIMKKIRRTVDKKTSGVHKWLALIGACGVFVALIMEIAN